MRHNPGSGKHEGYYRLVESYRNEHDRVCHRTLLNVGFLDGFVTIDQLKLIRRKLVNRYQRALGQIQIEFPEEERIDAEPVVNRFVEELWEKLVLEKRIDTGQKEAKKNGKKEKGQIIRQLWVSLLRNTHIIIENEIIVVIDLIRKTIVLLKFYFEEANKFQIIIYVGWFIFTISIS
jgi:hypothetical protein